MSKYVCCIIIPSWNNPAYLNPCIQSIARTGILNTGKYELIVVNNGKQPVREQFAAVPNFRVIDSPENVGWEGGLKLGLDHSDSEFVVFQNDDTYIPPTASRIYEHLLSSFQDDNVGLVGPTTTVASGIQSVYHPNTPIGITEVRWLIFFTVAARRSAIEKVGGIDTLLPGGDDFDLSIRMNNAGYKVLINPSGFLIHHGFKTGTRVHGDHNVDGGWNSAKMQERTNQALIQKHGFKTFFNTISSQHIGLYNQDFTDIEGNLIRSMVLPGEKVLELGCGFRKTVADSTGVDLVGKDDYVPIHEVSPTRGVADVIADVTKPMPFEHLSFDVIVARHIIEHCIDLIDTIRNWVSYLKPGGRLIIATPDEKVTRGIPLDPTHVHAFTRESLNNIMLIIGMSEAKTISSGNGVSFISVFEKPKQVLHTLDRAYEGDCTTIPLESYVIRGND